MIGRRRAQPVAALVAFVGLGACTGERAAPDDGEALSDGDREAIREVVAGLIAADNAGDLEAVLGFYADDALLLPPNRLEVRGKEAVREHYAGLFRDYDVEVEFESRETEVLGDWAFDRGITRGRLTPKAGGPSFDIHDRYVMLLRHGAEGDWRIARLVWNPVPVSGKQ